MNILQGGLLGLVQGLTEFLPVSSSGHLVIAQSLMPGFSQPGVLFDVVLHLATATAIFVYFRGRILNLDKNFLILLTIGSVPAFIIGLLFSDLVESFFESTLVVSVGLLITAAMNWSTDKTWARRPVVGRIDALFIGVAQALAIIPGISRSGSTIFAATSLGVDRNEAARFSFILSVPAILGANFYQLIRHGFDSQIQYPVYLFAFLTAAFSGYLAISLVIRFLGEKKFKYFAAYCIFASVFAFLI